MNNRLIDFLHNYTVLIFRVFLGALFIYASIHKLQDPVAFSRIIYGYKILPPWAINIVAIILPGVELTAGLLLIVGLFSRGASFLIVLSLLVFICAIGYNLYRGLEFDCGCFSFASTKSGAAFDLLIRDIVLFALSIRVLFANRYFFSLDGLLGIEGASRKGGSSPL